MATTRFGAELSNPSGYMLYLSDGYVSRPDTRRVRKVEARLPVGTPHERIMAEVANSRYWIPPRSGKAVWVIGREGWLEQLELVPDVLKPIVQEETRPKYRIVIEGFEKRALDRGGASIYLGARDAGLQTRHQRRAMAERCRPLLSEMQSYYDIHGEHPTEVLRDLKVPFIFFAGSAFAETCWPEQS